MGVCRGKISAEDYRETVEQAVDFIKTGSAQSVERMEKEMEEAAERLEFEKAAMLRDRIAAVRKASEKQKMINSGVDSADVIGIAASDEGLYISVLMAHRIPWQDIL